MNRMAKSWIVLCVVALATSATADDKVEQGASAYPPVPLADVLDAVSRQTGRVFLTSPHVPADVVIGQLEARDISYASLLIVLYNNELAAVHVGEVTNIIHASRIRQYALPILNEDDDSIPEYEWVSRVVEVKNGPATRYVPILRPLLPQMAHLVADSESNTVLIVGRYANIKRLGALLEAMDKPGPAQDRN
jgi:general secretion pathway protein D